MKSVYINGKKRFTGQYRQAEEYVINTLREWNNFGSGKIEIEVKDVEDKNALKVNVNEKIQTRDVFGQS